jgi:Protein of unknown function (DUF3108)
MKIKSAFGIFTGAALFLIIMSILPVNLRADDSTAKEDRKVVNNAFKIGEKLTFAVKWGLVTAGYATMEVKGVVDGGNNKVYEIVSESRTSSFFDVFYTVRDTVKSYVDMDGIYSWRFEKHLKEGKYLDDEIIAYNQNNHSASRDGKTFEIPPYVQDILSAFYYIRTQKLEVGQEISIPANAGDKNYELIVKVLQKTPLKVSKGTFNTVLVEPLVKYGGIFQHKGRLLIWLTDDERKMPVLMRSKISVGSISAELVEASLP